MRKENKDTQPRFERFQLSAAVEVGSEDVLVESDEQFQVIVLTKIHKVPWSVPREVQERYTRSVIIYYSNIPQGERKAKEEE